MGPAPRPPSPLPPLPVDAALPALLAALERAGVAVLQAPPGSGKTTRVPLALLASPSVTGRIVVLEPRRVAARAAARRMAATLGEEVGGRVGYRIRGERVVGPSTRVEVVTEGVLTRMLQADPSLEGVGVVVFDEFHERSIQADLGLALCLDARGALRPDLRLLVMSATLDTGPVAAVLGGPLVGGTVVGGTVVGGTVVGGRVVGGAVVGGAVVGGAVVGGAVVGAPVAPSRSTTKAAEVVTAEARPWPVATVWLGRPTGRLDDAVARAVRRALTEQTGDVLAFLPGAGEIRRVEALLAGVEAPPASGVRVVPLHGGLSGRAQDEALRPAGPGERKVVLATSLAETSLTIDGVRAVVDSGVMRGPRFDPGAGMTRLVTVPVSRASADQRRGRSARQGPGVCYRLWTEAEHAGLPRVTPPEILVADLAPLALDLAEWGVDDPGELRWVDPPPAAGLGAGRALLAELGALDEAGRITPHGRALARLGAHPRIGELLLAGRDSDGRTARLAAEVAAILSEGDPLRADGGARDADLASRVVAVRRGRAPRVAETARRWQTASTSRGSADERSGAVIPEVVGRLVAVAYPDRVGRLRPGRPGHWLLRNGRGAWVPETDPMANAEWIVAAEVDGDRRDARIWLGAPLARVDVDELFAGAMADAERTAWDPRRRDVVAVRERRLGPIVVTTEPLARPDPSKAQQALLDGVRAEGLGLLAWTADTQRLRARVAFARRVDGPSWPDLTDEALLASVDEWLSPWLAGRVRRADLAGVPLTDGLWAVVGWARRAELDALAPTHLTLPTGERRRLDYPPEGPPVLAVRLQELFGTTATPSVAGGRVPVLLHLTSPAGRPVQVTSDLASFWTGVYPQVRGELRARYPRHAWPDDPAAAAPVSRPRPRRR